MKLKIKGFLSKYITAVPVFCAFVLSALLVLTIFDFQNLIQIIQFINSVIFLISLIKIVSLRSKENKHLRENQVLRKVKTDTVEKTKNVFIISIFTLIAGCVFFLIFPDFRLAAEIILKILLAFVIDFGALTVAFYLSPGNRSDKRSGKKRKNKSKVNRKATICFKIMLASSFSLGAGSVLIFIFISFFVDESNFFFIVRMYGVLFLITVAVLILLLLIFGDSLGPVSSRKKIAKADVMPCEFTSYTDLSNCLCNLLVRKKFKKMKTVYISTYGELTLYIRHSLSFELNCYAILYAPELTNSYIKDFNHCITDILTDYYGGYIKFGTVNMTSIFCIDEANTDFEKFINDDIQQGPRNGRLFVGVSFDEKKIYIPKQTDDYGILKYKHMRKSFIKYLSDCRRILD